jgi:hypothetical protein
MKTAAATIKGFEVMRMIRRGHCLACNPHVKNKVRFVNKLFDVFQDRRLINGALAKLRPTKLMPEPFRKLSLFAPEPFRFPLLTTRGLRKPRKRDVGC